MKTGLLKLLLIQVKEEIYIRAIISTRIDSTGLENVLLLKNVIVFITDMAPV